MTQAEVAAETQSPIATVIRTESGKNNPNGIFLNNLFLLGERRGLIPNFFGTYWRGDPEYCLRKDIDSAPDGVSACQNREVVQAKLAVRICALQKQLGLTSAQFARGSRTTSKPLFSWRNGEHIPSGVALCRMFLLGEQMDVIPNFFGEQWRGDPGFARDAAIQMILQSGIGDVPQDCTPDNTFVKRLSGDFPLASYRAFQELRDRYPEEGDIFTVEGPDEKPPKPTVAGSRKPGTVVACVRISSLAGQRLRRQFDLDGLGKDYRGR